MFSKITLALAATVPAETRSICNAILLIENVLLSMSNGKKMHEHKKLTTLL